jgi:hypothetical protein
VSLRIAASPVGVARIGKNRLPPGLVVYVRPLGDVHSTVPTDIGLRYRSSHPPGIPRAVRSQPRDLGGVKNG